MTDYIYLDTSVLMRWLFMHAGSPEERDKVGGQTFETLLNSDAQLRLSPITVVETSTNLHNKVRDTNGWFGTFDGPQAERSTAKLMTEIATGRIEAVDLGARTFETALMWVSETARLGAKWLPTWDACHLAEAVHWSRELGPEVSVQLATSDRHFAEFLEVLPGLASEVAVLDVTVP